MKCNYHVHALPFSPSDGATQRWSLGHLSDQEMKPCIEGGRAESRKNLGPKPHEATMYVSGYLDCHMEKGHFSIGVSHCGIFIGAAKNHS